MFTFEMHFRDVASSWQRSVRHFDTEWDAQGAATEYKRTMRKHTTSNIETRVIRL